ncbi:macro domain-containing protein [Acrocarpospora sp. B8E8]|uniref:macro domain-containing protein n=1 Tax=Acrocarpospora sp. B8E8 TaxID=3153572 RepID=UPI00325DB29E
MNRQLFKRAITSGRTIKAWLVSTLAVLGGLSGLAGLLDALFPDIFEPKGWFYLLVVVLVSIAWGTFQAWPRSEYSRYFPVLDTTISITVGNLFDQAGHLVIGMSDTFDTDVPKVIKDHSVQGQLLGREYQGDIARLDREIAQALKGVQPVAVESVQNKPRGKRKRYPLGSVLVLGTVQRRYFCCAYSVMSNNCVAQATAEGIWTSLARTWEVVREAAQHDPVSIPIVGSGLARLSGQLSRTDLIRLILLSFLVASRQRIVTRQLHIVIHPTDALEIDLRQMEEILSSY